MPAIRSFRELNVYKLAGRESKLIFAMSKRFPREEMHSLTDQIRRSSRAVGALLAEAWARRRYPASFVNRFDDSLGEAMETQAWLDHAIASGYIERAEYKARDTAWQQVGAMLQRMIDRADDFCRSARAK
jgi:four helix bundle protein